jgi:hypothetical protein
MSNTHGQVIHDGNVVGHIEYYGSSSCVPPRFFDTYAEVDEHWRTWPQAECTCGQPPVPVLIWVEYGSGYHWPSDACLICHVITGLRSSYDEPLDIDEWPKDGHPLGEEHETEWTRLCRG